MKTATYCRTSTDRQDGEGQRDALARAVSAHGWGPAAEFVDLDQSGMKESRPEWDRLLRQVRAGQVGRLVVPALDRLGRRALPVLLLVDELGRLGCDLVSLRENLDTTTPMGRCFVVMLAALAQLERDVTVDRIKQAIRAKRARGQVWGRPRKPAVAAALTDVLHRGVPVATAARRHGVTPGAVRAARCRGDG